MATDLPETPQVRTGLREPQADTLSLGQKTFAGAIWMTVATLAAKGISFISQIALAWFLDSAILG